MYGTEDHHQYVRLLTALELLRHRDAYECTDGILGSLPMATASYSRLVTEAVTMGEYAELSHIYAVSAAYGVVIQSYMPAITITTLDVSPDVTYVSSPRRSSLSCGP